MADGTASMPGVYVSLDDLIALEYHGRKVSFLPHQPVRSLLSGRFASRMRGRGLNFEEIRDYRPGDDVRSIDWKVTARLQKPHIRVFNEERDRQTLLVVDQRLSMFFGSRRAMKSVTAAEAAAIGAWRVLGAGDRIGAIVFDDRELTEFRARRSRSTVLQILTAIVARNQALGVGRGLSASPSMLNNALQQAQRRALHDAVVIIISDFDGADDDTRKMVGAMARHNDVVALLVHDPLQSDLPASASMTVTDGELRIHLEVGRESVRTSILEASQARLQTVFAWTPELGVPVLPLSAAEDTAQQLRRLLGTFPPARGAAAAMVTWERALADAQTKQADPLAGLIDIPLPQEASLWSQTWPLRIAIVLISVLTVLAIWKFVHRYRANRYRREALSELDRMSQATDTAPDRLAAQLSLLVRRTALGTFPRETVAPLTGTAWLSFLDRSYGGDEFSKGAGRWLVSAPYQRTAPGRDGLNALRSLVRRWIRVHHV